MNIAELIYREARHLPEGNAREVLEFVEFLKFKSAPGPLGAGAKVDQARRKADLLKCFSRFQIDMTGFRFDREDANVRR